MFCFPGDRPGRLCGIVIGPTLTSLLACVLVIYGCVTNDSNIYNSLRQRTFIILQFLWVRNPDSLAWCLCLKGSHEAAIGWSRRCHPRAQLAWWVLSLSKLTHVVVGRPRSLSIGLPYDMAAGFPHREWSERARKKESKKERKKDGSHRFFFYNLIAAVMSHDFCQHILLVRTELVRPTLKKRGLHRVWIPEVIGSLAGGILKADNRSFHSLQCSSKCHPIQRKSNACVRIFKCQAFTDLHFG